MPKFSPQLVSDTIACFKEEDGIELTQEQAIEALESFAGLYLAFAEGRAADPAHLKAAELPPDLIPPEMAQIQYKSPYHILAKTPKNASNSMLLRD